MNSNPPTERLEKRLARVAREQGIDQERLRRWVSFLAFCGVLEKSDSRRRPGRLLPEGSAAMELRFGQRARATKELDLGIEGSRGIRMQTLTAVLQLAFDDFTFRVKPRTRNMEQADTIRVEVAVQYRTRAWQTFEVDLGPAKVGPVDLVDPHVQGLTELGIPVTSPIRCLRLADQVAQKTSCLHGPAAAGRARDVLDILLIEALGKLNYFRDCRRSAPRFEERRPTPSLRRWSYPRSGTPNWRRWRSNSTSRSKLCRN